MGPLQQHLRLNVRSIHTFNEALETAYSYIKSRHPTVPSGRMDHQGQADIHVGALKGKKRKRLKGGKGMHNGKGYKGKGKGKGKKGHQGKGKGRGQGCFLCSDPNHGVRNARKLVKVECQL